MSENTIEESCPEVTSGVTALALIDTIVSGRKKKTRGTSTGNPEEDPNDISDHLLNAPMIPKEVYQYLPKVLKTGTDLFISAREKDVFLTSALTIMSGLFPTVHGLYDRKRVYPNLYSFIVAPAASGKSTLTAAKDLAQGIHNELVSRNSNADMFTIGPGISIPLKMLYIPGNISSASIITLLNDNQGIGIICESEADSMSTCLKQEWGSFSDLLRKAFHHEHISYSRKKDNEFIEVKRPRLSVSLSGTPSQVPGMIKSIHDGLFSRFIFYIFRSQPKWKDVSPMKSLPVYDTYITSLQEDIKSVYEYFSDIELSFDLTVLQWIKLNRQYADLLKDSVTFVAQETSSIVMRLGLVQFRIAMILSIFRHFEQRKAGNVIECADIDYSVAETLCNVYLDHSLLVYKIMSKQLPSGLEGNLERFFSSLPKAPFRRKEAVMIGEKLNIGERTVNKYLKTLKENNFLKQEVPQGSYLVVSE